MRRTAPSLLTLGLLAGTFAGCVQPHIGDTSTHASSIVAPAAALEWWHLAGQAPAADGAHLRGEQLFIGRHAPEPTLGITKDDVIFMSAQSANPSCQACPHTPYSDFHEGPTTLRTTDLGRTFTDVFPKLPTGDSYKLRTFDPDLWVDRDTGRVFMDDIYPLGCGFLSFSSDLGRTWTHSPFACGNPNVNDHPTVVTARPRVLATVGYPNLVYRCTNNIWDVGCAISLDGGAVFLPQRPIPRMPNDCLTITGHLAADPDGRVFIPLGSCTDGPHVLVTEDDGLSWQSHRVNLTHVADTHDLDVSSDPDGILYAVWPSDGQLFYSSSSDHGTTWAPAINVTAPPVTAIWMQAITARGPGRVAFTYLGTTAPGGYKTRAPACCTVDPTQPQSILDFVDAVVNDRDDASWADVAWNAYIGLIDDARSPAPLIHTVQLNPSQDPVARGQCAYTGCWGMADFIDIDADSRGTPWAVMDDVCNASCVTDPSVHHDQAIGFLGTVES